MLLDKESSQVTLGGTSYAAPLVAGAAAGVAAVFKAPLTGVIFALEAPYRRTFVHSAVVPALVGSTVGYLTLIVVTHTIEEAAVMGLQRI